MSVVIARRSGFGVKLALKAGPGDGKTFSALLIASHIVANSLTIGRDLVRQTQGKIVIDPIIARDICLIETEDRGREYCEGRPFHYSIEEPEDCSPKSFLRALEACKARGVHVVIIDSYTDEWRGKNGCLEQAGHEFQKWNAVKDDHWDLLSAILAYPGHVIVTLRVKEKFAMVREGGKNTVQNLGFQAEQEKFIEYRFPIVIELDEEVAYVTKSACDTLSKGQKFTRPGKEIADAITAWSRSSTGERSAFEVIRDHFNESVCVTQKDLVERFKGQGLCLDVVVAEISAHSQEMTEREIDRLRTIYKVRKRELTTALNKDNLPTVS